MLSKSIPRGLGSFRMAKGEEYAERVFYRLKHLMSIEKLQSYEIIEAREILREMHEYEV
jgi:hypothetical protein